MKVKSGLAAAAACLFLVSPVCPAQPAPKAKPQANQQIKIIVESVRGRAAVKRAERFIRLKQGSQLQQGDLVVVQLASVLKLEFQHPASGAVLAAAILRGYTEVTVAEAYVAAEQPRIMLDMPQGLLRAGVVRTAVPPSFVVRSPRVVVAVRGTEIAQLEVSCDRGDRLLMGRVGVTQTHDAVPLRRSARAGQGTQKRTESDRRGGALLRAVEHARLTHRVIQTGPHRAGLEIAYDRHVTFDPLAFNPGEFFRSEGNPGRDRAVHSQVGLGRRPVICPFCPSDKTPRPQ